MSTHASWFMDEPRRSSAGLLLAWKAPPSSTSVARASQASASTSSSRWIIDSPRQRRSLWLFKQLWIPWVHNIALWHFCWQPRSYESCASQNPSVYLKDIIIVIVWVTISNYSSHQNITLLFTLDCDRDKDKQHMYLDHSKQLPLKKRKTKRATTSSRNRVLFNLNTFSPGE